GGEAVRGGEHGRAGERSHGHGQFAGVVVDDIEPAAREVDRVRDVRPVVGIAVGEIIGAAQAAREDGRQAGGGQRIAGGDERDVVAHAHELFGQEVDDRFGAAVRRGRDTLPQRGELQNTHRHSCIPTVGRGRQLRVYRFVKLFAEAVRRRRCTPCLFHNTERRDFQYAAPGTDAARCGFV